MDINLRLVDLIEKEGIHLTRKGKTHVGLCPFHEEKHPSFTVYEDSNHFICFGCGEKGDAIDFIKKLKGFSFKEALAYLGINGSSGTSLKSSEKSDRRKLIAAFRKWENDYHDELCTEYRGIISVIEKVKNIEEAEELHLLYHRVPILEYQLDLLREGTDEDRFLLFKQEFLWQ